MLAPSARNKPNDFFSLKAATADDLDDIVEVVRHGFPDDPEVNYRFPFRDRYPGDYIRWTRKEYADYLEQDTRYDVQLVLSFGKVIALAVWDNAVFTVPDDTDIGLGERRDANEKHCLVYDADNERLMHKYFAQYGQEQLYLWLIVTLPSHRRCGAAAMLMNWGLNKARRQDIPVTVFASPLGEELYKHFQFVTLGREKNQAEGEEEYLDFAIMERQPFRGLDCRHT